MYHCKAISLLSGYASLGMKKRVTANLDSQAMLPGFEILTVIANSYMTLGNFAIF